MSTVRLVDSISWYLALAFVFACAFLNGGFSEPHWLWFSALFYGFSALVLLNVFGGGRCNRKAVLAARPVLMMLVLSLLWLWLPQWVNFSHPIFDQLLMISTEEASLPQWFDPVHRWSVTPVRGKWLLLSELLFACLFFIVLLLVDSRRRLKQLLYVLIAVALLHALTGLLGKFGNVLFVDSQQIDGHFSAARGLFVNRNHFGAFLVLCLVGVMAFEFRTLINAQTESELLRQHLNLPSIAVVLCMFIVVSACLASESRGALLAMAMAMPISLVALGLDKVTNIRWLLLGMSLVLVAAFVYFGQGLFARFANDSLSFGERPAQWAITLEAIWQNPFFGYGGGSYGTVFQAFRDDDSLRQVFFAQSHNHYLHLWLERGLVGLGLWLAIWVYVLRFIRQNMRNQRSTLVSATLCAILLGLLAALLQSMVDFNLQILNVRAYFMILMAMAFAVPQINHR